MQTAEVTWILEIPRKSLGLEDRSRVMERVRKQDPLPNRKKKLDMDASDVIIERGHCIGEKSNDIERTIVV